MDLSSAINVIESVAGFTDSDTAVGEAWAVVLAQLESSPAPAEGEVAEVAAWLRVYRDEEFGPLSDDPDARWLTRAADLLEQRHPAPVPADELLAAYRSGAADAAHAAPVPVPVAERLPGPGDCDAEGRCWVHQPHEACPESPAWELMPAKYASANYEAVCWLPAAALPLPQGEVE